MDVYRSYQSFGGGRRFQIIDGKAYDVTRVYTPHGNFPNPPRKFKGRKTTTTSSSSSSSILSLWDDPEMKRRRRVAKYRYYAVEGKVKASLKKGFRWFKRRCSKIIRGF